MTKYHYANILFSGPCNIDCIGCIKHEIKERDSNLLTYPLKGIEKLLKLTCDHFISDLAFSGTSTDPLLYKYGAELIRDIRSYFLNERNDITKLSLHTNGVKILEKINEVNSYDKVSISLPSYNQNTFALCTQSNKKVLNMNTIVKQCTIPLKLSMFLSPFNFLEINEYISKTKDLGIKRLIIRKPKGKEKNYPVEDQVCFRKKEPIKQFCGWPVYNFSGLEVTVCGFNHSKLNGLFLYSDGNIRDRLK